MPSPTANFATPVYRPDLRNADPADWPERVFSTDPTNVPSSTLAFEHGRAIIRGSGAGTGVRSNRRSAFLVPGSPKGYGRMRSTLAGLTPTGANLPQWGHMHGICPMPDGAVYGVLVWTDIILGSVTTWNFGVWRAEDPTKGIASLHGGARVKDRRNLTAAVRSGHVVTLTVDPGPSGQHGFNFGDQVAVDLVDGSYDGTFELTSVTATQVVYAQDAANAGTSTGTIR